MLLICSSCRVTPFLVTVAVPPWPFTRFRFTVTCPLPTPTVPVICTLVAEFAAACALASISFAVLEATPLLELLVDPQPDMLSALMAMIDAVNMLVLRIVRGWFTGVASLWELYQVFFSGSNFFRQFYLSSHYCLCDGLKFV